MTATPAAATTHMHPGGIEHYHEIASERELYLHLFYGHDLVTVIEPAEPMAKRHRQAHAGEDAIQRGAEMGEAFAGLGRRIPEGPASAASVPSGQSVPAGSRGTRDEGGGGLPATARPDPAAQMARAFVEAVRRLGNPEISPAAVETVLAEDIRTALRSYR